MDWYYWLFRYFFFGALIGGGVCWSFENATGWWWSVLASMVCFWLSQMRYLWSKKPVWDRRVGCVDNLSSVYVCMMVLRSLAFVGALAAWVITLYNGERFVSNEEVEWVRWSWVVASSLWVVSLVPLLLSLFQCLIDQDKKRIRGMFVSWLLHDLVLGGFWIYLSYELYDLPDDVDDSAWRTLFRSMIAWHGVIVLFQEISRGTPTTSCNTKCFSTASIIGWGICLRLVGLLIVYIVIMMRFESIYVLSMGMSTGLLTAFIIGVVCIAVGVWVEDTYVVAVKNESSTVYEKLKYNKKSNIQF